MMFWHAPRHREQEGFCSSSAGKVHKQALPCVHECSQVNSAVQPRSSFPLNHKGSRVSNAEYTHLTQKLQTKVTELSPSTPHVNICRDIVRALTATRKPQLPNHRVLNWMSIEWQISKEDLCQEVAVTVEHHGNKGLCYEDMDLRKRSILHSYHLKFRRAHRLLYPCSQPSSFNLVLQPWIWTPPDSYGLLGMTASKSISAET